MSEFHAEASQATASECLAHGPYVAARVGFEPTTLWTKGDESTNEPPRPTTRHLMHSLMLSRIDYCNVAFAGLSAVATQFHSARGGHQHSC